MARTTKKRTKQLKHDKFRDTTFDVYGRLSHRIEGRERTLLYALAGVAAVVALLLVFNWWRGRQAEAASAALGKAIEIAETPVATGTPLPGDTSLKFASEKERAQKAVEAFQKVQSEYGSPYSELARYFAAASLLTLDRPKGLGELEALAKSGDADVSARSKFALAQARESDAQYDQAGALYQELLADKNRPVSENTLKLRLAAVYEKQGKRDEAADLLFQMVEAARKAQGKDGKPLPESAVIGTAADKLQELDPARFGQLSEKPKREPGALPF
ncbi:MAG TPA: hypothetical protein VM936_08700 [Pyrinomonadaceae bacterium]|nr:hypothetical protein [Pyrinomonadaceae bacterium]